jgi:hypothetical protein
VHESELYEEMSDFSQPFVPHSVARPRFALLGVSGVNVDLTMKPVFWNVFRSLLIKICGSCLLNKQIYTPTNFWQQVLI